jgi:hypothetical protein
MLFFLIYILVPNDSFYPVSIGMILKLSAACYASISPSVVL